MAMPVCAYSCVIDAINAPVSMRKSAFHVRAVGRSGAARSIPYYLSPRGSVWPGGAERLDLGIASMKRVLADDAARFGSAVGSVHWLKHALLHPALPAGGGWAGEPGRSWKNHGAAAEVPG